MTAHNRDPQTTALAREICARIEVARKAAKMTQRECAAHAGLDKSTYHQWRRGAATPRLSTLYILAQVMGVSIHSLLPEEIPACSPA